MGHGDNEQFKLSNVFDIKGKTALITGAGSGIGLMMTQALAVNGAKVYIVGRTEEKLETVVREFGQGIEGEIIPVVADITKKEEIKRLVSEIESREPYLSILVNNAGISGDTQLAQGSSAEEFKSNLFEAENSTFENWESVYRTNVSQIFFLSTAFLPLVAKTAQHLHNWSGTIISTTSISGLTNQSQNHFAYNASKAAANHVMKMLASEIANSGVKVRFNSIAPGVFPSEMTTDGSKDNQKSELSSEKYEKKIPSKRPGQDRDMASAILFAATNQYLNGQVVAVDGGYLLATGT